LSERITISVAAGGDDADARAFAAAMGDILTILESLAREQLGKNEPVVWRIVALAKMSPPSITLECRQNVAVARRFYAGLGGQPDQPANSFPPRAMRAARRLAGRMKRQQVDSIVVASPGLGFIAPTQKMFENAATTIVNKYYSIPSSVDGKLDVVNVHSRAKFSVFDDTHYREVRCHFSDSIFEKVRKNLGKRVTVIGNVRFDSATDRPVSITVEEIEPIDEDPIKPRCFSEMRPIDITGGLSSEDYVRQLRDGGRQ
jgi:hypothetical protein